MGVKTIFGENGLKLIVLPDMNKPEAKGKLIPVRDYAASRISRRGFPVSVQYIYKLIAANKKGKAIDFKYKEIDKGIWIVK